MNHVVVKGRSFHFILIQGLGGSAHELRHLTQKCLEIGHPSHRLLGELLDHLLLRGSSPLAPVILSLLLISFSFQSNTGRVLGLPWDLLITSSVGPMIVDSNSSQILMGSLLSLLLLLQLRSRRLSLFLRSKGKHLLLLLLSSRLLRLLPRPLTPRA